MDVPPLSLPARADLADAASADAVALFVERAQEARSQFELTEANTPAVARVCRMLDGIPLRDRAGGGVDRMLSVDQIAEGTLDGLELLTGGSRLADARHRTLRAALDWSHDLLGPTERPRCAGSPSSLTASTWRRPQLSSRALVPWRPMTNRGPGASRWLPGWSTAPWSSSIAVARTSATGCSSRSGSTQPCSSTRRVRPRRCTTSTETSSCFAGRSGTPLPRSALPRQSRVARPPELSSCAGVVVAARRPGSSARARPDPDGLLVVDRRRTGREWVERIVAATDHVEHRARAYNLLGLATLLRDSADPRSHPSRGAPPGGRRPGPPPRRRGDARRDRFGLGEHARASATPRGTRTDRGGPGRVRRLGRPDQCRLVPRPPRLGGTHRARSRAGPFTLRAGRRDRPGLRRRVAGRPCTRCACPSDRPGGADGPGVTAGRGRSDRRCSTGGRTWCPRDGALAAETAMLAGDPWRAGAILVELLQSLHGRGSRRWLADTLSEIHALVLEARGDGVGAVEVLVVCAVLREAARRATWRRPGHGTRGSHVPRAPRLHTRNAARHRRVKHEVGRCRPTTPSWTSWRDSNPNQLTEQ